MVEPVIAADEHTYERAAMQHWLQHHPTSPVTQALLPHPRLVPAMADLAAVDCKTAVPSSYSQQHEQYVCACFTAISRHVLPPHAGLVDPQLLCIATRAANCLAVQIIVLLVMSVPTILRLHRAWLRHRS